MTQTLTGVKRTDITFPNVNQSFFNVHTYLKLNDQYKKSVFLSFLFFNSMQKIKSSFNLTAPSKHFVFRFYISSEKYDENMNLKNH